MTNWSGFAFYLVTALLTSVVLLGKLAATAAASGGLADAKSYVGSLSAITTDGLIDGCMSYVLFWTYDEQRGAQGEGDAMAGTSAMAIWRPTAHRSTSDVRPPSPFSVCVLSRRLLYDIVYVY